MIKQNKMASMLLPAVLIASVFSFSNSFCVENVPYSGEVLSSIDEALILFICLTSNECEWCYFDHMSSPAEQKEAWEKKIRGCSLLKKYSLRGNIINSFFKKLKDDLDGNNIGFGDFQKKLSYYFECRVCRTNGIVASSIRTFENDLKERL